MDPSVRRNGMPANHPLERTAAAVYFSVQSRVAHAPPRPLNGTTLSRLTVMPKWNGNRDGFWYSDEAVEAGGGINTALTPPVFGFAVQPKSSGSLTANRLLSLLRLTQREFRECEVWCSIDKATATVLQQLADEGVVRWELVQHPYSRDARIIELAPEQPAR